MATASPATAARLPRRSTRSASSMARGSAAVTCVCGKASQAMLNPQNPNDAAATPAAAGRRPMARANAYVPNTRATSRASAEMPRPYHSGKSSWSRWNGLRTGMVRLAPSGVPRPT